MVSQSDTLQSIPPNISSTHLAPYRVIKFFQMGILKIMMIEELQVNHGIDIAEQNEKGLGTGEMSENIVMI